jgi:hypothetical protein
VATDHKGTKKTTAAKPRLAKDRVGDLLDKAIAKFEEKFEADPSLAEYLKLMQLKRELDDETEVAKEIRVTWVEAEESEKSD